MNNQRLKADLTLFFVAIIWGSAFSAQRIAAQSGSVYLFNGSRFLLAAVLLIPFLRNARFDRKQIYWIGAAGGILFVASVLQQAGMLTTTAGNAGFLTSLYVVFVPVLLFILWKEKPHWFAWVAVMMASSGAFLLSTAGRYQIRQGDWLELIGAIFWALHVILVGKVAVRYDFLVFAAGQYFIAGLLNAIFGTLLEQPSSLYATQTLSAIVFTGIFSVGLGYTLQVWAQRHTPPTDASLIISLEAVFAVATGWLLLNESLEPIQIAGCVLILLAVMVSQARELGFK